jgi:hypothetical protein
MTNLIKHTVSVNKKTIVAMNGGGRGTRRATMNFGYLREKIGSVGTAIADECAKCTFWSSRVRKPLLMALAFLLLASFAGPAMAVDTVTGTFWTGLVDGFLSLIKLLVSPLLDVSIIAEDFGTWAYRAGYYLGVLVFIGVAGAAASS